MWSDDNFYSNTSCFYNISQKSPLSAQRSFSGFCAFKDWEGTPKIWRFFCQEKTKIKEEAKLESSRFKRHRKSHKFELRNRNSILVFVNAFWRSKTKKHISLFSLPQNKKKKALNSMLQISTYLFICEVYASFPTLLCPATRWSAVCLCVLYFRTECVIFLWYAKFIILPEFRIKCYKTQDIFH